MFAATTGKIDDRWRRFMGFQISRTRQIFADAEAGVDQLAPDARLPVWCDLSWNPSQASRPASAQTCASICSPVRLWCTPAPQLASA